MVCDTLRGDLHQFYVPQILSLDLVVIHLRYVIYLLLLPNFQSPIIREQWLDDKVAICALTTEFCQQVSFLCVNLLLN